MGNASRLGPGARVIAPLGMRWYAIIYLTDPFGQVYFGLRFVGAEFLAY